jgi:transcriptional regulator with XRE-family HTH domain
MRQSTQRKKISVLSERLIKCMEEKNLNLSTLAQKANIAIGTVQKMITDPHCNPTINSIEAIGNALDVPISSLIGQKKSNCCSEDSIPKFSWETLSNDLSTTRYSMQESKSTLFSLEVTDNLKTLIFPIGSLLIFDKQKPSTNGAYVLVYLNETRQYLLKRLIIDEPNLYISSIHLELTRSEPFFIRKKQIIATLTKIRL